MQKGLWWIKLGAWVVLVATMGRYWWDTGFSLVGLVIGVVILSFFSWLAPLGKPPVE